jgi:hypothetical protein
MPQIVPIRVSGGQGQNTVEIQGVQYSRVCDKAGTPLEGSPIMKQLYYKENGVQKHVDIADGDNLVIENAEAKDSVITIDDRADLTAFQDIVINGNKGKDKVAWGQNVLVNTTPVVGADGKPKSNVKIDLGDGDDELDFQEQTIAADASGKGVPNMGFLEISMGKGNDLVKMRSGLFALGLSVTLDGAAAAPGTTPDKDRFYADGVATAYMNVHGQIDSELRFLKLQATTSKITGSSVISVMDAQQSGVAEDFAAMLTEMGKRLSTTPTK